MKIDLTKLKIEVDFNGRTEEVDCAKELANYVKNNTSDIGMEDVCREIYHSEGETDIPDSYVKPFLDIVLSSNYKAAVKRAVRDILTQVETKEKEIEK